MPPAEQPDAELVRLAQAGDVDAFAEIVRRHDEEAVQDAFVQAWRNLDRYRGEAALFTWLYRIGVNTALARRRRKGLATVDIGALEGREAPSVDRRHGPEAADLRGLVLAALAELSFEFREAVVLRDLAGLTNAEVAEALGVSIAAAKSRIHRGRLQLRDHLEPLDHD
ncbi:MAG: polymerase, sigma-24 subunit, subfamily [Thermoleophilia bacterium]|nr:polymerase, sigma-24 subunit, subfamily [Thermoleophilia bacterium]